MTKKVRHANPEYQWYIYYTCPKCGQQGIALFKGDSMIVEEGDIIPEKPIYCCQCKKQVFDFEDIECFEPHIGDD